MHSSGEGRAKLCRERRKGQTAGNRMRGGRRESERERESERTIGEKRGMGNGEMASEWVTRRDRGGGQHTSPSLIFQKPASRGGNGHRIRGDPRSTHAGPLKAAAIRHPGRCKCHHAWCPKVPPRAPIGFHRHPYAPTRTAGHPWTTALSGPPLNLVGHDRSMPACYGTMHWPVVQSRQYGYSVCGIESTPSVIMAQVQTLNAE